MKIAISGSNDKNRANLIKSFISQWPMYATPSETIFQDISWPESAPAALEDTKAGMNEIEQKLFAKILLIEQQYEKYKDVGYIIYDGCGVDVLVNALILCEENYVSEEFVEKVIYHNKKLLRGLDVVYYMPDNALSDESADELKTLESVYWNFYDNYQTDFDNSPFFDHKNCPSILLLDTDSPINEIKMLIDKNGNLEGTSHGGTDSELINFDKMRKALRGNPRLLEAAIESLKESRPQNIGSIGF